MQIFIFHFVGKIVKLSIAIVDLKEFDLLLILDGYFVLGFSVCDALASLVFVVAADWVRSSRC